VAAIWGFSFVGWMHSPIEPLLMIVPLHRHGWCVPVLVMGIYDRYLTSAALMRLGDA